MKTNQISVYFLAILFQFLIIGCSNLGQTDELENQNSQSNSYPSLIDVATPTDAQPYILSSGQSSRTTAVPTTGDWELVFSDEFDDTAIDSDKWTNISNYKWKDGINTWNRPENMYEGDGKLKIKYVRESNTNYSSGRYESINKFEMAYGYWECEMHIVNPNGYQTAFWMMPNAGTSPNNVYDGTANDGAEIDIIEGNKQSNNYSTGLHWDGYGDYHQSNGSLVSAPNLFTNWYNIYALEWSPTFMKFYYNGVLKRTITNLTLISQVKEHIILSGAFFGNNAWADGDVYTAVLPEWAYVNYVRVYKNKQMDYGTEYFKIKNVNSGKALSIENWLTTDGAKVLQTADNEFTNQLFQITHLGSGMYKIINKHSGKCVMLSATGYLAQQAYSGATNQKWHIVSVPGTNYINIKNASNSTFAEIENSSTTENARLKSTTNQNSTSAKWEILHTIN